MKTEALNKNLVKEENVLSEEELSLVSGGVSESAEFVCPKCGSSDLDSENGHNIPFTKLKTCKCKSCGHRFFVER